MGEVLDRLFELEPVPRPACADHGQPTLFEGWQELVTEVERCAVCFEVVAIRLKWLHAWNRGHG